MENLITFLNENNAYIDCANDEVNTTTANGNMISRLLMSISQNEIERTTEVIEMEQEKVIYLIDMIYNMDIKDKLILAICMSQSKWSGLIYNTKKY